MEEKVGGKVDPKGATRGDGKEENLLRCKVKGTCGALIPTQELAMPPGTKDGRITSGPSDETSSQHSTPCKEVLRPRDQAKATRLWAAGEETGMNAREGKAWDRGTIKGGGVATVDEGGDPSCKLCRGRRWHQAVLCMVEYTAGAISKASRSPTKGREL